MFRRLSGREVKVEVNREVGEKFPIDNAEWQEGATVSKSHQSILWPSRTRSRWMNSPRSMLRLLVLLSRHHPQEVSHPFQSPHPFSLPVPRLSPFPFQDELEDRSHRDCTSVVFLVEGVVLWEE